MLFLSRFSTLVIVSFNDLINRSTLLFRIGVSQSISHFSAENVASMFRKALSLCFVKLERLSFVVRGVRISAWVDGVLLSAVDSSLLTDSVIVNSLLEHESECKEFTKF